MSKLRTARATRGFSFLLLLSPCPTGWKSEPQDSVDLIRTAVHSGVFPLFEIFEGVRYRINLRPNGTPVQEYVSRQRRYAAVCAEPEPLQAAVAEQWRILDILAKHFPAKSGDGAGLEVCDETSGLSR
jgi:pyruvate/2-oxoacid:ferredoxin oxidoreductase beta subunit